MPVPVPERFDELTADWFDRALAEGGVLDATVTALEVEPLPPDAGLIGDLAYAHATFAERAPRSFVVKLPAANPTSRRIGDMLGAYTREVAFYRHLAPSISADVATCYYTGEDLSARRWALVIEAIEADDIDFLAGATRAQAAAAVDAMANLHADGWHHDIAPWMPGFGSTGVGGLQPLWLQNLPVFVERYAAELPAETGSWVLRFAPQLADWSVRAATEPLTVVHSDYRLDNLLFRGDRVTIIDWQTAMRAPAAMDLTCFLSTSLSTELRRGVEGELVDRYLARLHERGVEVDTDWFRRSCDENLLWWMGQFGNNLAHLEPDDDEARRSLATMVRRVYTTALDHEVDRLL